VNANYNLENFQPFILIAEDGNIRSENHNLITSVWNREELPEESIIIHVYEYTNGENRRL
jgi:hypothetical protein